MQRSQTNYHRKIHRASKGHCATVARLIRGLTVTLKREPTDEELATLLAVDVASIKRVKQALAGGK